MAGVWVPESAGELERALSDGTLPHESAFYEYKRQLPVRAKNVDLARDVCALCVEGGVLIYGVEEEKEALTFSPHPIELRGVQERIAQTVAAHVTPPPQIRVRLLKRDGADLDGFVLVEVPPSVDAPHMVEGRFWGRFDAGNRVLTEREVEALYARREHAARSADAALGAAMRLVPTIPTDGGSIADFILVAHPLFGDAGLLERALGADDHEPLSQLVEGTRSLRFMEPWDPAFHRLTRDQRTRTADGLSFECTARDGEGVALVHWWYRLEACEDGTLRLWHGGVARLEKPAVTQMAAHFALCAGRLYEAGGYRGPVDLMMALDRAGGCTSADWLGNWRAWAPPVLPTLPDGDYRERVRRPASDLADDPCGVAAELTRRVARIIRPPGREPLALADE
jgi:hypothetical protein